MNASSWTTSTYQTLTGWTLGNQRRTMQQVTARNADNNLTQDANQPTRQNNVLDLIISKKEEIVLNM